MDYEKKRALLRQNGGRRHEKTVRKLLSVIPVREIAVIVKEYSDLNLWEIACDILSARDGLCEGYFLRGSDDDTILDSLPDIGYVEDFSWIQRVREESKDDDEAYRFKNFFHDFASHADD